MANDEYTPTPEEAREDYARLGDVGGIPREVSRAEFDRMLDQVRAEARAEGDEQAQRRWGDVIDASLMRVASGEWGAAQFVDAMADLVTQSRKRFGVEAS